MTPQPPPPPPDPELPELGILLGGESGAMIGAAVGTPVAKARVTQVRYDPGRSMTATYAATLEGVGEPVTVCAYAGRHLPPNTAIVGSGNTRIAVWRFPDDPELPGLRHAARPELLMHLLDGVGVDGPIRRIHTRSYRPRRRAVIEAVTDRHRLFLKVVRPSRVADLQTTHMTVSGRLRVPRSLGFSPELGIAVLEAIPGSTMRHAIESGDTVPGAAELRELLDRLPALPTVRPGLIERLGAHQRFLTTILPEESARLADLVAAIGRAPAEPLEAAHNDFHSAQVIIGNGRINGLVDIDTVGLGRRADDYAMLLGHLHTLALAGGRTYADAGARLLAGFEQERGRPIIRLRTAAAVVAFATAPFRVQQPDWPAATSRRLTAAEQWLERGDEDQVLVRKS